MAFNRIIELSVGADGTGLLISDLHVEFRVTRSVSFEENTAEFTIYNAQEDTRKKVLKKGNNVIFKAGYDDEGIGTLFIGNIVDSVSSKVGADWVTNVSAASVRSATQPLENTYVSLSFSAYTPMVRPIQAIATALGLSLYGQENVPVLLLNGFTFVGSARGALRYCRNILKPENVALYIDNNEIVIYRTGGIDSRFTPVYLDYNSGLISIDDIEEFDPAVKTENEARKRIRFTTLIIPKILPNGLATIQTDKLNGTFFVEKVTFSGDNFAGENTAVVEAVE